MPVHAYSDCALARTGKQLIKAHHFFLTRDTTKTTKTGKMYNRNETEYIIVKTVATFPIAEIT